MKKTKKILDACCGSRMFWFDKKNPNAIFIDRRKEIITAKDRDKIRSIEINYSLQALVWAHNRKTKQDYVDVFYETDRITNRA